MKVLRISRGGMELAVAQLDRGSVMIGRSPSCDVVLRAPGVAAVQFFLEWIGTGDFDPQRGEWSIFDVSASLDDTGEGLILSADTTEYADFVFSWVEDKLASSRVIGGQIAASLKDEGKRPGAVDAASPILLELVQIRGDSGGIQEVVHSKRSYFKKTGRPVAEIPEFKFEWTNGTSAATVIRLILEEMKGAKIFNRGVPVDPSSDITLKQNELLQVIWHNHVLFLRLVPQIKMPPVPRIWIRDKLMWQVTAASCAAFALILGLLFLFRGHGDPEPEVRIARIEVPAAEMPAPAPVNQPAKPEPEAEKVSENTAGLAEEKKAAQGHAVAIKRTTKTKGPAKLGLNTPAVHANVNMVGILGALKKTKSASKGTGVSVERILNEGAVTQTLHGDKGSIVLSAPPSGMIAKGDGGSNGKYKAGLAQATTTLVGHGDLNPKSSGPIAREKAGAGFSSGTGLGNEIGSGRSGTEVGNFDTGTFQVSGGLDRETIRRVITGYRSQIRTCYERALLTRPQLAGRVVYTWLISTQGLVVTANITKTDSGSPILDSCVLEIVRSIRFPVAQNHRATTVIYPFVFQAKN